MRKLYFLLFVLTVSLGMMAQGNVQFYQSRVDCGIVKWKQPVTATFTLTNNASHTMTITKVHPDCSCTAVKWTRTPIAPGGKAQLQMTYDAELLGTFEKQVAVYTSLSHKPVYATMRGKVMMNPENIAPVAAPRHEPQHEAEDFNYTVGDIHLSDDNVEFDNVHVGDSPTVKLHVLNTGNKPYTPQVMHLPMWLTATAQPEEILPGHTGDIFFRLRSDLVGDYGLTQRSVYLSRFPGDVVGQDNELTVSATILPNLSTNMAGLWPSVVCDTVINLGAFNGKEKLKATIVLQNKGGGELQIGKLQVYNPGLMVSLNSVRVRAGGKTKLTVIATPSIFDHHGRHRILLITNDPRRPKVVIEVRASK